MTRLRRWGLGRIPAVAVAVLVATAVVATVVSCIVVQLVDVTMRMPEYQSNIEAKIQSLQATPDGPVDRAIRMFTRLTAGSEEDAEDPKIKDAKDSRSTDAPTTPDAVASAEPENKTVAYRITQPSHTPISLLRSILGTALNPLATAGIVFVMVIFMLLEREDLRDRLIRAVGVAPGQLNTTTQAIDDAAHRVSRYLLMQLIVNVTYGIPIGIGLYFIGVPNAALWGMMAIVLRFIPYLGPIIASVFPIGLAFAIDPGWGMVIWTVVLFAVIELISNNFVETWLYGSSVGISSVAVLLSALFWGWLWGPIGLLVSTPLTVCFMVMGRYIPALQKFSLLLGDQPGLPLYAKIYQRFLAMDADEPDQIAREYLAHHTVEEFYGLVLVPTLRLLQDERYQQSIEPARREFILENIRELIEDVGSHPDPAPPVPPAPATAANAGNEKAIAAPSDTPETTTTKSTPSTERSSSAAATSADLRPPAATEPAGPSTLGDLAPTTSPMVVCIPAHDEPDEIVALMLTILLRRRGIRAALIPAHARAAQRIEDLAALKAPIACVSVLPPFAAVYARHTVQRIRARLPGATIVVGFWEASAASPDLTRQFTTVGAAEVVSTMSQALASLLTLAQAAPARAID